MAKDKKAKTTESKTPYMDMYNEYARQQQGIRDAYRAQITADRDAALNASNAEYDNSARQNYINYMQAQKRLPSELNALGINGGASESSLLRLGTNYGSNVASNESARNAALAGIRQQYMDKLASYDEEWNNKLAQAYLTAAENQLKWEQEQAALKKSSGGGGGGSRRSYGGGGYSSGGSYSSSSSGGGSNKSKTSNTAANVAAAQQRGASMTAYYQNMLKNASKNKKSTKVWANNWSR